MFRTLTDLAVPPLLGLLLSVGACQVGGDEVTPADRSAQVEMKQGQRVEVTLSSDVDSGDLRAVAEHTEGLGNVAACQVKVKKLSDGPTTLVMEMWGEDLPDEQKLESDLKSTFAFLSDAEISVASLDASAAPQHDGEEYAGDPEEVRQQIIDKLRADGVKGDIDVQVNDGEDGREVEVRVEDRCETPGDCG
jgi:hypothetical protein